MLHEQYFHIVFVFPQLFCYPLKQYLLYKTAYAFLQRVYDTAQHNSSPAEWHYTALSFQHG